jgi:Mlc titration factor MtfA (ptsG expression regulator)
MLQNLLKQKNTYFKNLSPSGQQRFVDRVFKFMENKNFIGREGLIMTDEIRALISASAVQLTFGLKDYTISHLHTINVFPRAFYSKLFETSFKGLTTQGGIVSLSWDDFKQGYADDHDRMNLGLHELAHALNVDLDEEGIFDDHFENSFANWKAIAENNFQKLQKGEITFLRKYGGRSMHEFFAVCIEHFFELPDEFKKTLPDLYWNLAFMLNQDPENAKQDYAVAYDSEEVKAYISGKQYADQEKKTPVKGLAPVYETAIGDVAELSPVQHFIKKRGIYIAMAATFFGLFAGIPLLILFYSNTLVSLASIMVMFFLCGALGLIQWKFVKNLLDLEYHQFSMYAFSGFGMCLINFIFFINHMVHITSYSKTYEVIAFANRSDGLEIVLGGEGHDATLERNVAKFILENNSRIPEVKEVTVVVDTGLFGFQMINDCKIN